MSYLNGYTVKLRNFDEEHDITQYVSSCTTESIAGLGEVGSLRCAITLDNKTGEFTPFEIGGQGTYDFDLFVYCLTIEAEINTTPSPTDVIVFDGVIRDVRMSGNVHDSTVTLSCSDWVAVSTGTPADTSQGINEYDFEDTIQFVMNSSYPTYNGLGFELPTFGASSPYQAIQTVAMGPVSTYLKMPATNNTTAQDLLSNTVLPSGPFVTWPGQITFQASPPELTTTSTSSIGH